MSPLMADIVAKVFSGWRTKILRAADAFYARRREGPYRFIQNRSRTSLVALKSDAAAERSTDQLSRDFFVVRISTFATISARSGHGRCSRRCPLTGVKRKSYFGAVRSAYDPNVWSGRALQEVSSSWRQRSCINVSGL